MPIWKCVILGLLAVPLVSCQEPSEGSLAGYAEAELRSIAAPQSGWIEQMAVAEGDRVNLDDPLFQLDATQQQHQLQQARARVEQAKAQWQDSLTGARREKLNALDAQLAEARANLAYSDAELKRQKNLAEKKLVSSAILDQVTEQWRVAKSRVEAIQAQISEARLGARDHQQAAAKAALDEAEQGLAETQWRLEQRQVNTSVAGVVDRVVYHAGEWVNAGAPVVRILPEQGVKILFFLPEGRLSTLKVGDAVRVSWDGLNTPVAAKVSRIASEVEYTPPVIFSNRQREKLVYRVEAWPPAGTGLHPGQPVDVWLP